MQRYDVLTVVNGRSQTLRYQATSAREAAAFFRSNHRRARILSIVCTSADTGRRPENKT